MNFSILQQEHLTHWLALPPDEGQRQWLGQVSKQLHTAIAISHWVPDHLAGERGKWQASLQGSNS